MSAPGDLVTAPPLRVAPEVPLRFVAVGGGTGVPRVLAGLAPGAVEPEEGRSIDVTAIVTTADDGGSSGELRRRYGVPAPGDVRNCLVAMARDPALAALFQHRFDGDGALAGHTVGNVVLTALTQRLGDFSAAVDAAARMLGVRGGRVLPATSDPVELVAELADGRVVQGESAIAAARGRVAALGVSGDGEADPAAVAAILEADVVVLGPGSLYSSVLATLLVPGIGAALRETAATRVLVVNLFTQPGETDGHDAAAHVEAVQRHVGDVVDVALAHRPPLPEPVVRAYAAEGAVPVHVDTAAVEALGPVAFLTDLLAPGRRGRHDPQKLARALLAVARAR